MNTVKDLWEDFQATCVSPDLSAERLVQFRRIFYAGAMGFYGSLRSKLRDPTISDEEGERFFSDMEVEMEQYMEDLDNNRV